MRLVNDTIEAQTCPLLVSILPVVDKSAEVGSATDPVQNLGRWSVRTPLEIL